MKNITFQHWFFIIQGMLTFIYVKKHTSRLQVWIIFDKIFSI